MVGFLDVAIHLKARIREFVPPILWMSSRLMYASAKGSYSSYGIDKKIMKLIHKEKGFFVEVGANDGISASNTALLEKRKGWRGILIEPIAHQYLSCCRNRSAKNAIICAACVSFEYEKDYVTLLYSDKMTIGINLESDIKSPSQHAGSGLRFIPNQTVFEFMAPARTLTSILDQEKAPKSIDFLSIDVEGAEIEVLKGIDFDSYSFDFILVECRNAEKMISFLTRKNYVLVTKLSRIDLLFKKSEIKN
jgi:FkbM family methyltransferase